MLYAWNWGFPDGAMVKSPACQHGRCCKKGREILGNLMDRGAYGYSPWQSMGSQRAYTHMPGTNSGAELIIRQQNFF